MNHYPRWTPEEEQIALRLILRGKSHQEIGERLGRSACAVRRWHHRQMGRNHANGERALRRAEAARLLQAHPELSTEQVAAVAGISRHAVERLRAKLPPRRRDLTTPACWLDEPPARIKALRQAHGIVL